MNRTIVSALILLTITLGMGMILINEIPTALAGSDSQCDNQHEREDRFLDGYEADPDNNGKLQSFISSFKNTEPC